MAAYAPTVPKFGKARRKSKRSSPPRTARNGPGSTRRRTAGDIETIRSAIIATLRDEHPQTVRGLFYRLVSQGVVPKTEDAYKKVVVRLASELRLTKRLPFEWLTDATRWRHGSDRFVGLNDWLKETRSTYRRDLWADHDVRVQVWTEKETLTGVLIEETDPLCVDLYPCRGFPSITYVASAAAHIVEIGLPTFLYYIGDWDPSGKSIPINLEKRLREFAPDAEIHFERIAVNPDQIREFGLPTRPTKTTDSRIATFSGESVEVDAIPSATLRRLVREKIEQHINPHKLSRMKKVEALERESLEAMKFPEFKRERKAPANTPSATAMLADNSQPWSKARAWAVWERAGKADDLSFYAAIDELADRVCHTEGTFTSDDWKVIAAKGAA